MSYRTKLPYLFIPASLALALPAFSQSESECQSSADCAEGYTCEKGVSASGCDPDAGACDTTVTEEEFGNCVKAPVECETDADCGEYLACSEGESTGSCWQDSDGNSGCTEPDPDAAMYCSPDFSECETDADCPRSFECLLREVCPTIDCADGDDCELPACEPTAGECAPREIECETDSECPSDWSCYTWTDVSCSGEGGGEVESGGSDGGGSGDSKGDAEDVPEPAADPVPDPDSLEIPEETTCVETSGGVCQPNAWDGLYYGVGEDGSATSAEGEEAGGVDLPRGVDADEDSNSKNGDSDEGSEAASGGCSVSARGTSSQSPLSFLLLLGAPLLAFRRRRAAQS